MTADPVASASTYPDFQLYSLGWKAFQDLCLTVLSDQFGQAVQRYSPLKDGGRDGAFVGEWNPTDALRLSGETVVQCKFTNRRDATLTISAFRDEFTKAKNLWRRRLRDNYVVLTSYRVTAEFEESARQRFAEFGCNNFHVFGYEWLAGAIQQSPRLRLLVPRLYGLGDLSQILDERWYAQTRKLLEVERDNLRKFVPTRSYRQAVNALNEHGFVLLLGEPAVGKTAIAATLTLASGDAWKCRPMKIERAPELREHWNPDDPKQLFWIDDAFGATQYDGGCAHEWNSIFPWLVALLRSGGKVILTSRDYIYTHARRDLKQGAFPLLHESQVVVDVADLTPEEREQILYNHIRLGDQPKAWRRTFKQVFDLAAQHEHFRPEIARRLGTRAFTKTLILTTEGVSSFIARPEEFLRETIKGLSDDDRSALAAIFLRGGILRSPVQLTEAETEIISRLGGTLREITAGLIAMRGSFVRIAAVEDESWMFKHPTIGDAFASLVADNPELVDLYISGASMDKLLKEVTCGRVALVGVKLVVPASRFDIITCRLHEYRASREGPGEDRWSRRRQSNNFLANRCSKEFLERYIIRTSDFWKSISRFGSYLSAVSEFDVLVTLRQYGLLSEQQFRIVLERVKDLAAHTPDADFLRTRRIRQFFTDAEIDEIMAHVRQVLVPDLDKRVQSWGEDYSSSEDAGSYFSSLREALHAFRNYFVSDNEARCALSRAIGEIDQLISEYSSSNDDDDQKYNLDESVTSRKQAATAPGRRIFDDLDA